MPAKAPPVEPVALTVNAACAAGAFGRTWLYRQAKLGRIRLTKIGGKTLVPMSELRRLVGEAA